MVMPPVLFFKVDELPSEAEANAFYYIQRDGYAEAWLTSVTGEPFPIGDFSGAQWGAIAGDISAQEDLMLMLAEKVSVVEGYGLISDAALVAIAENTGARHTHANKEILDQITAPYTAEDALALAGVIQAVGDIDAALDAINGEVI